MGHFSQEKSCFPLFHKPHKTANAFIISYKLKSTKDILYVDNVTKIWYSKNKKGRCVLCL